MSNADYWKATALAHEFNTYIAESGGIVRDVDRELRYNLFVGEYGDCAPRVAKVQRMVDYLRAVSHATLDRMRALEEEEMQASRKERYRYDGVVTAYKDTVVNLATKLHEAALNATAKECEASEHNKVRAARTRAVMEHLGLIMPTASTPEELAAIDFRSSTIVSCRVCRVTGTDKATTVISEQTKYAAILVDVWATMCAQKVLQNTSFNFKLTDEHGAKGFHWSDALRMSFQRKDATATMREIMRMVELNGYEMDMTVRLGHGRRVRVVS